MTIKDLSHKRIMRKPAVYSIYRLTVLSHLACNLMTTIVSFLHLAGVVNRGACAISQEDLHFFQNTHEAHGLHVYWQAEEAYKGRKLHPEKLSLAVLNPSVLMPFGNTVQGIFSSALMYPLRDSSVQRSSHLEAPLSA